MKKIISLFTFLCITIVIYAQSDSSSRMTSVTFNYDKIQEAKTDKNFNPIDSTTTPKDEKGLITFNQSSVIINDISYKITGSKKIENRYEVAASNDFKNYLFYIATVNDKNIVVMVSFSDLHITAYKITDGFTLEIPFLNSIAENK